MSVATIMHEYQPGAFTSGVSVHVPNGSEDAFWEDAAPSGATLVQWRKNPPCAGWVEEERVYALPDSSVFLHVSLAALDR